MVLSLLFFVDDFPAVLPGKGKQGRKFAGGGVAVAVALGLVFGGSGEGIGTDAADTRPR
jgi:hypothetical protein